MNQEKYTALWSHWRNNNTRNAQKVLQHLLYFTQNQQEISAIFSVVNSEHPACYHSATEQYIFLMYAQGIIKIVWYGYVCFKQCTVTEFLVAEKSIMNIHKQLKKCI